MKPIPYPKVIFFIADSAPSDEEYLASLAFGPGVVYRRADYAGAERPELADAVAGKVPPNYALYPTPDQAIRKYQNAVDELRRTVQSRTSKSADVEAQPTVADDGSAVGGIKQDISPGTPGTFGHTWSETGVSLRPLNEQPLNLPEGAADPREPAASYAAPVAPSFAPPPGVTPSNVPEPPVVPPAAPVAPSDEPPAAPIAGDTAPAVPPPPAPEAPPAPAKRK
jgi:hypothetical protein